MSVVQDPNRSLKALLGYPDYFESLATDTTSDHQLWSVNS